MKKYIWILFIKILLINELIYANQFDTTDVAITVFICDGQYAEAYHSINNCKGLSNCKGSIYSIDESSAIKSFKRRPCCICWNIESGCVSDEFLEFYLFIHPPIPTFREPFFNSRNSMHEIGMYRQEKYDSRKEWIQKRINGQIYLISLLFSENNINCKTCNFDGLKEIPRKKISEYAKSISAVDFAEDHSFNNIVNNFNINERFIYNVYAYTLRRAD